MLNLIIANIVPILIGLVVILLVGVVAAFWLRSRRPVDAPGHGTDIESPG